MSKMTRGQYHYAHLFAGCWNTSVEQAAAAYSAKVDMSGREDWVCLDVQTENGLLRFEMSPVGFLQLILHDEQEMRLFRISIMGKEVQFDVVGRALPEQYAVMAKTLEALGFDVKTVKVNGLAFKMEPTVLSTLVPQAA